MMQAIVPEVICYPQLLSALIRQRIWHYNEGWLTSTIHFAFTLYQEIL